MAMPQVGETALDFASLTDSGETIRLSDYRGQRVVLYFYPKSDTPGCTKQACSIRDSYANFQHKDVVILGASPNTVEAQAAFKGKYSLPFILLADADHSLAETYGLWGTHKILYQGVEHQVIGGSSYPPTDTKPHKWDCTSSLSPVYGASYHSGG